MNLLTTRFAVATSTATGTATFTFAAVTQGQWWTVACTVPGAPANAVLSIFVDNQHRYTWLGGSPSPSLIVTSGSIVTVKAAKLTASLAWLARLDGGWAEGQPTAHAPQGPGSFSAITNITTLTVHILPVVKTVGVFTGRVELTGLTSPVPIIPTTRDEEYFSNLKIGWGVWGDLANTNGPDIYIGDAAGGTTATGWARIPSGKLVTETGVKYKIIGSFDAAVGGASWGNAWVARVAGTAGDVCNVWAA